MYRVTKQIEFCYGHRLLEYHGPCQFLHGHNARVEIELAANALDARGMVTDFRQVKAVIKEWIDRELDHRMVLRRDDPAVAVLQRLEQPVFLMDGNPTAENLARCIFTYAQGQALPVVEVRFWETPTSYASYRGE